MSEIIICFNGTRRDALFGLEYPEFDNSNVSFDAMAVKTNINPFRFENGTDWFVERAGDGADSLMFVFKLYGDDTDAMMQSIGAWTHLLDVDPDKFHVVYRVLNDAADKIRTFIYRVYANDENLCEEHPEMLIGQPLGMYHCPVCMEMVVAGVAHPTKAEIQEMHNTAQNEDVNAWRPADVQQVEARIKRGEHKFRTREEQDARREEKE